MLIVAGGYVAQYWLAYKGELKDLGVAKPHEADYPDREGYTEVRGHGSTYVFEALDIGKDIWRQKEFLELFSEKTLQLIREFKPVVLYIFAEKEVINILEKRIPKRYQGIIAEIFPENLVNQHPYRVLEKIKKSKDYVGDKVPVKEEARKILNLKRDNGKKFD